VISIRDLEVHAGPFRLEGISFSVTPQTYAVLMGRTGSGKTTLLEALCGLLPVRRGRIELAGVDHTRSRPAARGIGYVPQDGALFTTRTVREHLEFALRIRRRPAGQIRQRVDELATLLGISYLLSRRTHKLSGGEKQRVALGRALSFRPAILCLDEPFGALDEDTREEMYTLMHSVREQTGVTTLHVTHSRAEARRMGDQILLLREGAVHSGGRELLTEPNAAPTA
jgi:molybdate/tungstate transport system ATP-binding protein